MGNERRPDHPDSPLSRRDAVVRGLLGMAALGGAGSFLSACASSGSSSASLPSVRWPSTGDTSPRVASTPTRTYEPLPSRPTTPTPSTATPGVLPRRAWASGNVIPSRMNRMLPVQRITIHHDGMPPAALRSRGDVAARIDLIRESHLARGWGDIGYHFVVDPAGNVWEGRPLAWQGAHVGRQNEGNVGVLVLGNFEEQRPTGQQVGAVDDFVADLMARYRVSVGRVHTHRELAQTACPGRNLQPHLNVARAPGGKLYLA